MTRLIVNLSEEERLALWRVAEEQRRPMKAQAAILIRQKLQELGYLEESQNKSNELKEEVVV